MKKFALVLLAGLLGLVVASDASQFRVPVTVVNGSATVDVATVYNSSLTGWQLTHVISEGAAAATNVISYKVGSLTIGIGALSNAAGVVSASAVPFLLKGDQIVITSGRTNAHTAYIVGEEK